MNQSNEHLNLDDNSINLLEQMLNINSNANANLLHQMTKLPESAIQAYLDERSSLNYSPLRRRVNIPDHYCCPITLQVMREPVLADDGYSYEKEAIESWVTKSSGSSPITRQKIGLDTLRINRVLKQEIDNFVEKHIDLLLDEKGDEFYLPEAWKQDCRDAIVSGDTSTFQSYLRKDPRLGLVVIAYEPEETLTAFERPLPVDTSTANRIREKIGGYTDDLDEARQDVSPIIREGTQRTAFHLLCESGTFEQMSAHVKWLCDTLNLDETELMTLDAHFCPIAHFPEDFNPEGLNEAMKILSQDSMTNIEDLERCYRWGVDLYTRDPDGNTLLHLSVAQGALPVIRQLYEMRPDLLAVFNAQGETPLHVLFRVARFEVLPYFAEILGSDGLEALKNEAGDPILSCALSLGASADSLNYLLTASPVLIEQPNKNGILPLNQVIDGMERGENSLDQLNVLLEHNALSLYLQSSELNGAYSPYRSPAHQAIEYGNTEVLLALLTTEHRAIDVDHRDHRQPESYTLLQWATFLGQAACVQVLLENGAQLDLTDSNHRTALQLARAQQGEGKHDEIIELLLSQLNPTERHFDLLENSLKDAQQVIGEQQEQLSKQGEIIDELKRLMAEQEAAIGKLIRIMDEQVHELGRQQALLENQGAQLDHQRDLKQNLVKHLQFFEPVIESVDESVPFRTLDTSKLNKDWFSGTRSFAVSSDGVIAVTGLRGKTDGEVAVWNLQTGQLIKKLGVKSSGDVFDFNVKSVAISHNGLIAISANNASRNTVCKVWDIPTGQCLKTLTGHDGYIVDVALTSDGTIAFAAATDGIKVWDVQSGECLKSLPCSGYFCITPDGSTVAVAVNKGQEGHFLQVWDVDSAQCRTVLFISDYVNGIYGSIIEEFAITADGSTVVIGLYNMLQVWDIQTGQCVRTLMGHTSYITNIALTPDGMTAVSGSQEDSVVNIWDLCTGKCIRSLDHPYFTSKTYSKTYFKGPTRVAISPDGSVVTTFSGDNTFRSWQIASHSHDLTMQISKEGLDELREAGHCTIS